MFYPVKSVTLLLSRPQVIDWSAARFICCCVMKRGERMKGPIVLSILWQPFPGSKRRLGSRTVFSAPYPEILPAAVTSSDDEDRDIFRVQV